MATSFETDLISGWLGNDEARHNEANWLARRSTSKKALAEKLKEWHFKEAEQAESNQPPWVGIALKSVLGDVDWEEVADDFWEEPEGDEDE